MPKWKAPMLATLYKKEPFNDPGWLFERKFDGVRCLVFSDGKQIRLMSRNQKDVTSQYPELVPDLKKVSKKPFILDGEIVVRKGKMGSFGDLQNRIGVKNPSKQLKRKWPVHLYLFDILFIEEKDVRKKPLTERKKILKKLEFTGRIHYTDHENKNGSAFLKKMKNQNYEGTIAKKKSSRYSSSRSRDWLKLKVQAGQELVVGGYTDPQGERRGFGALLVGYYSDRKLIYAGKVGTGYSDNTLRKLHKKLKTLERKTSPFDSNGPDDQEGVHWVSPKIVAEIAFTEWTSENKIRHPAFKGLRTDKDPEAVVKEG